MNQYWTAAIISFFATAMFIDTAGAADEPEQETVFQQQVVVVVGAGGTEEYGNEFMQWFEKWRAATANQRIRLSAIGTDEEPEKGSTTDRQRLKSLLNETQHDHEIPLWLVFLGHGTFDGTHAKFNLRGPDVSSSELASWLKEHKHPLIIVNCTASSAPFINHLSGPNRIVVTATKSGQEHNFARFGRYLSEAISLPEADLDKDDQTSVLEAFLYASDQVANFYTQENRLATEHALLDDNGDGLGTPSDWFTRLRATKKPANASGDRWPSCAPNSPDS